MTASTGSLDRLHWSRRVYRQISRLVSPIAFSVTLDDHLVIEEALRVRPGDVVLALSSAGDTPLNLLAWHPARVDAVDISWPQIHLARLKRSAMRRLDLPEFRTLLGFASRGDPVRLYRRVCPDLEPATRAFWDGHCRLLARGIAWQGSMHRLGSVLVPLARCYQHALPQASGMSGNPYLSPLLLRQLPAEHMLPPYLSERSYAGIRRNLERATFIQSDVRQYLARAPAGSIDCFALSNVADWLTRADLALLCEHVVRTARPGARMILCSRRRQPHVLAQLPARARPTPVPREAWLRLDRIGYFRTIHVLHFDGGKP